MFNFIENRLGGFLYPLSQKIGDNKTVRAISEGFLRATLLTLGMAAFAIIGNLPIPAWLNFLKETGLAVHFTALQNASMNILGLYVSFTIAYTYAKYSKFDPLTAGLLSTASYLALLIQTVKGADGEVAAFSIKALGGDSVFGALLVGLLVSRLYVFLKNKNLTLKMPDTVPPAIAESLNPVFIAMIIFTLVFIIRVGFSYTSFGNAMTFISQIIGLPLMKIGLSIPSVILISVLGNFVWFFGIHSNVIQAPLTPLLMTSIVANITAFQAGDPLPYFEVTVVFLSVGLGGGLKLALNFAMLFAKSERYKSLEKIALIPALFNINEPTLFGFPMVLNPYMFLPLVFSPLVVGIFVSVVIYFFPFSFNPTALVLPFTTPFFVKGILGGGLYFLALNIVSLGIATAIYYPFFKMADRKALEEEIAMHAENTETLSEA